MELSVSSGDEVQEARATQKKTSQKLFFSPFFPLCISLTLESLSSRPLLSYIASKSSPFSFETISPSSVRSPTMTLVRLFLVSNSSSVSPGVYTTGFQGKEQAFVRTPGRSKLMSKCLKEDGRRRGKRCTINDLSPTGLLPRLKRTTSWPRSANSFTR